MARSTKIDLINEAIAGVLSGPSGQSFQPLEGEDSLFYRVGILAWNNVNRKLRSKANWSFLFGKKRLVNGISVSEDEDYQFRWKFSLPKDYSRPIAVGLEPFDQNLPYWLVRPTWINNDTPYADSLSGTFDVRGSYLYSFAESVWFFYQRALDQDSIDVMPEYFQTALVDGMASYLALPLGQAPVIKSLKERDFQTSLNDAVSAEFLASDNRISGEYTYGAY